MSIVADFGSPVLADIRRGRAFTRNARIGLAAETPGCLTSLRRVNLFSRRGIPLRLCVATETGDRICPPCGEGLAISLCAAASASAVVAPLDPTSASPLDALIRGCQRSRAARV